MCKGKETKIKSTEIWEKNKMEYKVLNNDLKNACELGKRLFRKSNCEPDGLPDKAKRCMPLFPTKTALSRKKRHNPFGLCLLECEKGLSLRIYYSKVRVNGEREMVAPSGVRAFKADKMM